MPIRVKGPDGAGYQFPDGTSDDVIKGAMAKQYGAPQGAAAPVAQPEVQGPPIPPAEQQGPPAPAQQETSLLQKTDDIVRALANGATFGYADKLAGYLSGTGTEEERRQSQAAHERMPWASTAAEIAGGVGSSLVGGTILGGLGGIAVGRGPAILGRAASAMAPAAASTTGRLAGAAATGAGLGAVSAAGHDEDIGTGAALGAGAGVAGQAVGRAIGSVADRVAGPVGRLFGVNRPPPVMTREALHDAAQTAYRASENAGVQITPQAIQRLQARVTTDMTRQGRNARINREIPPVERELANLTQGGAALPEVDILRQVAGQAAGSPNAGTRRLAGRIQGHIDDFLDTLRPRDISAGNPQEGVAALRDARRLWAAQRKSQTIDEALNRATNNAAAKGSGGNIDNDIRQQFRTILNNPRKLRGFTPDERIVMQALVRGTPMQNIARLAGKMAPSGNGLMLVTHVIGALKTGGASIPVAAAGTAIKAAADSATGRNVARLDRLVRGGGNLAAMTPQPNAAQRLTRRVPLGRIGGLGSAVSATNPGYPPEN